MSGPSRPASVFASALALASLRSHASAQTPPTFPAGVELVRIDVVVLDHGTPVTGLTAADFEVTENGRPHEIVSFEPIVVRIPSKAIPPEAAPVRISAPIVRPPEENRYFLIFFDDVHLTASAADQARAQLMPFLERELRDGDIVAIVAPLAHLRWAARTAFEHRQLLVAVQGLKGGLVRNAFRDAMTDYEAMRFSEYAGRDAPPARGPGATFSVPPALMADERYELAKRRVRQSLGGIADSIESLAGFRGRKSLIVYSEGFIKSPSMPDYDRTIELARRAHVAVYFVDPRGLRSGLLMAEDKDEAPTQRPSSPLIQRDTEAAGSDYVATSTGGRSSISNDVTALLHDAMVESSAYYLIGFQPSPGDPGERKLKVRVRREGLTVRAPARYIAGAPETPGQPLPPAVHALRLVSDTADIPLRVSTLFLDSTPTGEVTTTVAVELGRDAPGTEQHPLNLLIEARPLDRGEPLRDSSELSLPAGGGPAVATRELRLRPGVWQARVVVRDPGSERLGSLLHTFEVPSATGLRLSSPILTDELEPSRIPRPRLRLDRRYRSGGALYCQYRVFGAAKDATTGQPRVRASYAIRHAGQVIKEAAPSAIEPAGDGTLLRFLGFGLAGFAPGDYALVLRATDEVRGKTCETNEPFTIIPAER
jgi:VWFA-related protein